MDSAQPSRLSENPRRAGKPPYERTLRQAARVLLNPAEGWRVLRGGSWFDHEWGVRLARRLGGQPDSVSHNTGFRVARQV